jgi:DNA-binding transcriptional MerR regulator
MGLFSSSTLPPADATFTVREIARHAEVSLRTIRHYIAERVLPAPEFRSSKTRYDRAFLVRLRAAMVLRRRGLHVSGVREQLAATSPEEMIRLAGYDLPAGESARMATAPRVAAVLGATTPSAATLHGSAAGIRAEPGAVGPAGDTAVSGQTPHLPPGFLGPYRAGAMPPHERWDFFEVCPGVKLLVRSEADPEAWRVANEIVALFGPRA